MIVADYNKLDNPAWYALTETQKNFAIGSNELKCYRKNIVAFAAYHSSEKNILNGLDELYEPNESFFIIDELPALPSNYIIETILPCLQMICLSAISITPDATIVKMKDDNEEEMTALVHLALPGYYKPGTRLMGDYFGIKTNNQLVSLAGERIRMNGFTEISAVVTHPGFTGRKYAQHLISYIVNKNINDGIIPFLHVSAINKRAIKVYEFLGFEKRRIISFTKIKRLK